MLISVTDIMINTDWIEWVTNQSSLWDVVSKNWTIPFAPHYTVPKDNKQVIPDARFNSIETNFEIIFNFMCRLEDILISPVQLGILTGILISLFIRYTTTNDENENIKIELLKWHHVEFRKWFYTIATFLNFLILSPILVTICYLFGIYKRIAGFRLRVNIKKLK